MPSVKNSNGNKVINEVVEVIVDPSVEIEGIVAAEFNSDPIKEEAFMNEVLTILVPKSTNDNDAPYVLLGVNHTTQPVVRGVKTRVKRKYVEVLARCRESKYKQETPNPMEPDRIQMMENSALTYPFQVLHDPSPEGPAWLEAVMLEA